MYFEINSSQKILAIRRNIDAVVESVDPSRIHRHLPGDVTLVEDAFSGMKCEEYAIGSNGRINMLLGILPPIYSARKGDIVLYYDGDRGTGHVGLWKGSGIVFSKWGRDGPVLEHPWDHVPSYYGDTMHFRRKTSD